MHWFFIYICAMLFEDSVTDTRKVDRSLAKCESQAAHEQLKERLQQAALWMIYKTGGIPVDPVYTF